MYRAENIVRALKVLGFNVRVPDGGHTAFCIHSVSKEELWLPLNKEVFADDALEFLFDAVSLPMKYFSAVYMGLGPELKDLHPSDQH